MVVSVFVFTAWNFAGNGCDAVVDFVVVFVDSFFEGGETEIL